jgi:hypothetical protein
MPLRRTAGATRPCLPLATCLFLLLVQAVLAEPGGGYDLIVQGDKVSMILTLDHLCS